MENANFVIQEQAEDDWYGYYLQGVSYYLSGDYALSAEAFQQAIEREPSLNWPYSFAIMAALRQGDVDNARTLAETILQEFPDPALGNRILQFIFGEGLVVGPSIGAAGNMVLGQYQDVLEDADAVLAVDNSLADMHFLKGFAHCNLGDYAAAEDAYTEGITLNPDYLLLYLLRAEVLQRQGKNEAAVLDIQTIMNSPDSMAYAELLMDAQAGALSCETFWEQ